MIRIINITLLLLSTNVLVSCGSKNKMAISGGITTPTEYKVKHQFSYDVTAIEDACADKMESVPDPDTRAQETEKCIEEKELLMSQLFSILTTKEAKEKIEKEKDK